MNAQGDSSVSVSYEDELTTRLVQNHAHRGIVWLNTGIKPFLALYQQSEDSESTRAAIILHSMGMHADWPEIISPMRFQLPNKGWATLSVQLPVLAPEDGHANYGSTFKLANSRLRASIRYLLDKGYSDIVIIGYNFGATSAVNYLTSNSSVIKAMIGISMQRHEFLKPKYNLIEELSKLRLPILDIYGDQDNSDVVKSADDRRLAGNNGGKTLYNQHVIKGANHYFVFMEDLLVNEIVGWLEEVLPKRAFKN